MGREIVNIQAGQAGNQVGEAFWAMLLAEHGLDHAGTYQGHDEEQLTRVDTYFTELAARNGQPARYHPRSLQLDLERGVCNRIRSGPIGGLFKPDNWIHGQAGAGNNWARGYYTEGAELIDNILEVIRKESEACDCLQGFQIIQSLGGGTGSGLGSLILQKLREEEPDKMLATFSLLPSPRVSDTVVEPYNALLSLHQLTENSDLTICIDNEALYDICTQTLRIAEPRFEDLNTIISQVMCGVSTSLRFPGQLNGDLRKLGLNLVPFPRLHFLLPSCAPMIAPHSQAFQATSVPQLVSALFDKKNLLVACDPRFGRYLTAATIFRGNVSSREAEAAVFEMQYSKSSNFVEWIPDNISITLSKVPPVGQTYSATCLANSTSIQELIKRIFDQFQLMFKRRAFLAWYSSEGMDIQEFMEAESSILDLLAEYQQYGDNEYQDEAETYSAYDDENPSEY